MQHETVLPGPVRQIGYVVRDLDAAVAHWLKLGVGPWFVMRGLAQRGAYRGEPCEVTLSLALANSGELQVEIIQQTDAAASIFTEFLDSAGEGFHQLAYWTDDFDATMARVAAAGWPVVWSGGADDGVRFSYVELGGAEPTGPARPAAIIEIMELTEASAGMAAFVRRAAENWDGSDPIRELG
ncbi:MAG TPA: VOC family protein [Candidatus Limnocylindria bacterium]|nr:VOC family protein [Candidatus Limnocylindria bacterium]